MGAAHSKGVCGGAADASSGESPGRVRVLVPELQTPVSATRLTASTGTSCRPRTLQGAVPAPAPGFPI